MIVCSCNVLSDQQIAGCLRAQGGQCRVRDVYESLGCQPQCGRCARTIAALIDMHADASLELVANGPEAMPALLEASV